MCDFCSIKIRHRSKHNNVKHGSKIYVLCDTCNTIIQDIVDNKEKSIEKGIDFLIYPLMDKLSCRSCNRIDMTYTENTVENYILLTCGSCGFLEDLKLTDFMRSQLVRAV